MEMLTSRGEILALLAERPERTRTFQVSAGLLKTLPVDSDANLRRMSEDEVQELGEYLGVATTALRDPFLIGRAPACGTCGRVLTFLDFVKTSVDLGSHSRRAFAQVLTGEGGEWITIQGRDGGRRVNCAGCGNQRPTEEQYWYGIETYRYA